MEFSPIIGGENSPNFLQCVKYHSPWKCCHYSDVFILLLYLNFTFGVNWKWLHEFGK